MIQSSLPGLEYSGVQQSTVQFSGDFLVLRSTQIELQRMSALCSNIRTSPHLCAPALCQDSSLHDSYIFYGKYELGKTVVKQSIYWWRGDRYYLWTLDIIVYTNLGPWRLNFPELENKQNWE